MRPLILAAVLLATTTAHAADGFTPFTFTADLRGFKSPKDIATTCVLAIAASGDAHRVIPQDAANWCINAALLVFKAFEPKPDSNQ